MQSVSYRYPSNEDMMPTERLSPFDSLNVRWRKDAVDYLQKNAEYIQDFNDFIGVR
jgi:hypothetical protein